MRRIITITIGLTVALGALAAPPAPAEQAGSQVRSFQAGLLDTHFRHTCAITVAFEVRCWGANASGSLGYGHTSPVGDDEVPSLAGPVPLGAARIPRSLAVGDSHSCIALADGDVLCWGGSGAGQLGQGNTTSVGDNETPASTSPVDLGGDASFIAAGNTHTCAIRTDGRLLCWGGNGSGQLGYGHSSPIGDDPGETPTSAGPVDLGPGRTAVAVAGGGSHTCAILDDATVRCWGIGLGGRLGYGNQDSLGDGPGETAGSGGPVDLGPGAVARAISAGQSHTCALLAGGSVRCWGFNGMGQLGLGHTENIGDDELPSSVAPVRLGEGRTAVAISAGAFHTCAILDDGSVRCWGRNGDGELGYGNVDNVGDATTPDAAGPVDLGPGRTAVALTAGDAHTCVLDDDGTLRCWGGNSSGQLGYGHTNDWADDPGETPAAAGPLDLGGLMFGSVGDLSVELSGKRKTRVGKKLRLRVTLESSGLDAGEPGLSLRVPKRFKVLRGLPDQGTFDKPSRTWSPGPVLPGDPAELVLTLRARKVGRGKVRAEIMSDSEIFFDTDSVPGNAAAGEDDLAARRLKVRRAA